MHSYYTAIILFLQFSAFIQCVPNQQPPVKMTLRKRIDQKSQPNWVSLEKLPNTPILTYSALLKIARDSWLGIRDQRDTNQNSLLVASFWDPERREVYSSTAPKGEYLNNVFRKLTDDDSPYNAPLWMEAANLKKGVEQTSIFPHAEDGTYFQFEDRRYDIDEAIDGDMYPPGCMVAIWGIVDTDGLTNLGAGSETFPCDGANKQPGCQDIAKRLGVSYRTPRGLQGPASNPALIFSLYGEDNNGQGAQARRNVYQHRRLLRRSNTSDVGNATNASFLSSLYPPLTPTTMPESYVSSLNALLTVNTTATPSPSAAPICLHEADPDNDQNSGQCVCSQAATTTTVAIAGTTGNPCPWTTLPITNAAPVPSFTPPQQTGKALFTETRALEVVACTSSVVSRTANAATTACGDPSTVLSVRPHATAQLGKYTQSVGILSGEALSRTLVSALDGLCPTPAPNMPGSCNGSTTLSGIHYNYATSSAIPGPRGDSKITPETVVKNDGILVLEVHESNYTSTAIRDFILSGAATAFANSTSAKNACNATSRLPNNHRRSMIDHADLGGWDHASLIRASGPEMLCGAMSSIAMQYINEDINRDNPAAFANIQLTFHEGNQELLDQEQNEEWDCLGVVSLIQDALGLLGPELLPLDIVVDNAADIACGGLPFA